MTGKRLTVLIALLAAVGVCVVLATRVDTARKPEDLDQGDSETEEPGAPAGDADQAEETSEAQDNEKKTDGRKKNPFLQPGPAILLLNPNEGLKGRLDEELVFHATELVKMGPVHSGPPLIDRTEVKRIIWPEGVDPAKYK